MSERLMIEAEPRSVVGKKVKTLRREGIIPAVIYGQNESVNIQLDNRLLRRVLREAGTSQLIDLQIGGTKHTVLAREIQQHVTRGELIHVDFLEVDMKVTITSEAELIAVGQAAPQADGMGVGTLALRSVEIECLPDDLISEIEVDMTQIETIDDVLYVSDLPVPEGVTILTDSETVVARFETVQEEEEEEEEEESLLDMTAADAVEVIGKGKDEEEEEEEEF